MWALSCSWEIGEEAGGETERWRQKVEDGESVTFWGRSLLTLSWSCRTCRCGADRRFVWTGGQARSRGSERMLRTLKVSDSMRGLGSRGDIVIYWLLGRSSWPQFEVTVTATGNGNVFALIFTLYKLCSMRYANKNQDSSRPILRRFTLHILNILLCHNHHIT